MVRIETIVEGHSHRTAYLCILFTTQDGTAHDSTSQRDPHLLHLCLSPCVQKKLPKLFQARKSLWSLYPNSGVFLQDPGRALPEFWVEEKKNAGGPHGISVVIEVVFLHKNTTS